MSNFTPSNPEPLRAGLIGCGQIARMHAKMLRKSGFHLQAVCDRDRAYAEKFLAENPAPEDTSPPEICDSAEELVARDDLDLVVIATPPWLHAQQAIATLQAGKAVLCEKPSSLSYEEDRQIADAAAAAGKHIAFCSSRLRYGGYTEAARHAVSTGRLGKVYRAQIQFNRPQHRPGVDWMTGQKWFTSQQQAGGGVLFDMGCYLLDQMLHILGWPNVRTVDATTFQGHPHGLPPEQIYDVEEHANLFARLNPLPGQEGEIALSLDLSACSHEPSYHKITLLGTEAGIEISHADGGPNTYESMRYLPIAGRPPKGFTEKPHWDAGGWNSAPQYDLFARHLRGDGPGPGTTMTEALHLSQLLSAAYQSAQAGAEIIL